MGFKETALEDRDCLQPEQRKTENLPPGAEGRQAGCTVCTLSLSGSLNSGTLPWTTASCTWGHLSCPVIRHSGKDGLEQKPCQWLCSPEVKTDENLGLWPPPTTPRVSAGFSWRSAWPYLGSLWPRESLLTCSRPPSPCASWSLPRDLSGASCMFGASEVGTRSPPAGPPPGDPLCVRPLPCGPQPGSPLPPPLSWLPFYAAVSQMLQVWSQGAGRAAPFPLFSFSRGP